MTIKELSQELGTSKKTIERTIKKLDLQTQKSGNKTILTESQGNMIRQHILGFGKIRQTENASETATKRDKSGQDATENASNQVKTRQNASETAAESDTIDKLVKLLQEELARKDETIADLQNKLDNAYTIIADMAQKAQYITAADKALQIQEKQEQRNEESAPEVAAARSDTKKASLKRHKRETAPAPRKRKGLFDFIKIFK